MNFLQLNPVFPLCKKHVATRRYKNVVGIAAVLLATLMSMGSAVCVAVSHATAGALTGHDVIVLLPAMYLIANPVQNVGRSLETAEVNAKYYLHIITVCAINALLSIWVMQIIV